MAGRVKQKSEFVFPATFLGGNTRLRLLLNNENPTSIFPNIFVREVLEHDKMFLITVGSLTATLQGLQILR